MLRTTENALLWFDREISFSITFDREISFSIVVVLIFYKFIF